MNSKFITMWGTSEMLLVLLMATTYLYLASDCSSVQPVRFGRSNEWKTIELTNLGDDEQFYDHHHMSFKNDSNNSNNNKKLVEWDDDDNFVGASLVQEPKLTKMEQTIVNNQKSRFGKMGKLVYHGQLKRNNSRVIIDGVSLKVNTYLPHSIDRNQRTITKPGLVLSQHQHQPSSSQANYELVTFEGPKNVELMNNNLNSLSEEIEVAYPKPETEWQPITLTNKYRQLLANFHDSNTLPEGEENNNNRVLLYHSEPIRIVDEPPLGDSKWRPITGSELNKRIISRKMRESITYGRKKSETAYQPIVPSYIEDPFEDDRTLVSKGESKRDHRIFEQKQNKTSGSRIGLARKLEDSKWTPLEMNLTTIYPNKLTPSTTVEPVVSAKLTSSNHSESAQRSASDVNYIYSSQPNSQYDYGASDNRQTNSYGNSYYSNYNYNGQQSSQDSSSGAIIDTVSGQTPEMIDRTQEPGYQSDYGSSYSSYQSQTRPYSYDTSAYYTSLSRPSIPLRQTSSSQSNQGSPPIVRQEHHYHYYNPQQQQQQQDRQQVIQQQPQVVREIQPLLISQPPVIQALPLLAPSSTPPPQIIREIIKEVPQQVPVHYHSIPLPTRILLPPPPPPPPIPLPLARSARELEPSYGYGGGYGDSYSGGGAQSRSLIRHFSSAMPTIGVRQIRVPVPTIQIPVRVAVSPLPVPVPVPIPPPPTPSVTRQTGSFVIPPQPQKTTTYLTETQAMPTHTTIMQTTQFTPATRTTVYTTDHQLTHQAPVVGSSGYKK